MRMNAPVSFFRRSFADDLEALIEEARRRACRRRARNALLVAALGLGVVLAAAGRGGGGSSGGGTAESDPGGGRGPGAAAHTQPFPDAPASQHFATFGRCPTAPANRYLPHARVGCLSVRRTDIDGDGRQDLVLVYALLDRRGYPRTDRSHRVDGFRIDAVRSSGARLRTPIQQPDLNSTILVARDVNARRGAELFVHETHVTTEEMVSVYSFDGKALRRAGRFAFGGSDAGIRFGVQCRSGSQPTIVQRNFAERIPFRGAWDRTDITYRWHGARLDGGSSRTVEQAPTRSQVGVHC